MRRLAIVALVTAISSLTLTATATSGSTENIKDKFTSIGWGGSDGSLPWSGNWQELGDDGDEKFGNVRVVSSGNCASGNCIQIGALTTLFGAIGASRRADTSDLVELELCFDIKATGSLLGSTLEVQVDDGDGWETVKEYEFTSEFSEHRTIDIADFSSEEFGVRFRFTSGLLGSQVFIDNVEIQGVIEESEETTTTTVEETTTTTGDDTTTTSTTEPRSTTTTMRPDETTSTTTVHEATSTTNPGSSTSSTTAGPDQSATPGSSATTSTTTPEVTVTSDDPSGSDPGPDGAAPDGSGIRAAARGLQASFQGDLYGEVRTVSSLNGVDFQADYNMAVEVIKATWAWVVILGLLIAWAIVSGLDRRRGDIEG